MKRSTAATLVIGGFVLSLTAGILASVFLVGSPTKIKESNADAQQLSFTRYCLNGYSVLRIKNDKFDFSKNGEHTEESGYIYELNGVGAPKVCK